MLLPIKKFISELLSENGHLSTVRFMSIWCLAVASFIAIYGVLHDKNVFDLVLAFLGTAFTGKVAQRFAENKKD